MMLWASLGTDSGHSVHGPAAVAGHTLRLRSPSMRHDAQPLESVTGSASRAAVVSRTTAAGGLALT